MLFQSRARTVYNTIRAKVGARIAFVYEEGLKLVILLNGGD